MSPTPGEEDPELGISGVGADGVIGVLLATSFSTEAVATVGPEDGVDGVIEAPDSAVPLAPEAIASPPEASLATGVAVSPPLSACCPPSLDATAVAGDADTCVAACCAPSVLVSGAEDPPPILSTCTGSLGNGL